jgi:hypothetical protein
VNIRGGGAYA